MGSTDNLVSRLKHHNSGATPSTKSRRQTCHFSHL
ncbi:hypothetical protein [Algoriphagus sp. D3-2-R+10]